VPVACADGVVRCHVATVKTAAGVIVVRSAACPRVGGELAGPFGGRANGDAAHAKSYPSGIAPRFTVAGKVSGIRQDDPVGSARGLPEPLGLRRCCSSINAHTTAVMSAATKSRPARATMTACLREFTPRHYTGGHPVGKGKEGAV